MLHGECFIDLGVSSTVIKKYLTNPIKMVYLTHKHGDHIHIPTLRAVVKDKPTVKIALPPFLLEDMPDLEEFRSNIIECEPGKTYSHGDYRFMCERIEHGDTRNVAWHIYRWDGEKYHKTSYVTDTGYYPKTFVARNYDTYLWEVNHDEDTIQEQITRDMGEAGFSHRERAEVTHLSLQKTELKLRNSIDGGRYFEFHPLHMNEEFVSEIQRKFPQSIFKMREG